MKDNKAVGGGTRNTDSPKPGASEMSPFERFWARFEDWFLVRGEFAPKGMTCEFAVATRWLTRIGSVLITGALAYFMMLAIDKGWIGPEQRVYGMMLCGIAGTSFGAYLKSNSEKYSILGEVCASLGLVSLYLAFGFGYRYFDPPVIASGYAAFAGLFAATLVAGFLSVRLKSLTIACLGLAGGFLVPVVCNFTNHFSQLHFYLLLLSVGATVVAFLRGWLAYGFVAIAVAYGMGGPACNAGEASVFYLFTVVQFAQFMFLSVVTCGRSSTAIRSLVWSLASVMSLVCLIGTTNDIRDYWHWAGSLPFHFAAWAGAFSVLAAVSRSKGWGGTPVMTVFAFVCVVFSAGTAFIKWWDLDGAAVLLMFTALGGIFVELAARSGVKTLHVLSSSFVATLSQICFALFLNYIQDGERVYVHNLVDRMQYLWPAPALVAFTGWRLGAPGMWISWLRKVAYPTFAVATFIIVTAEGAWFGREFLPSLRGGAVTIVWAMLASVLVAVGIIKRVRISRIAGLGLLGLVLVKLLLLDTERLATPGRVAVFGAVGVLMIAGAFLYLRFRSLFVEPRNASEEPGAETEESK